MSAVPKTPSVLSPESCRRIDREIAKYPAEHKQSAVMAALAIAQDEHGWLPEDVIAAVANYLDMAPIAVYEVASFYSMYKLQPAGRCKLTICTNLPCALSGANQAAEHLKRRLGIGFGETTADGQFTLKEGECLGACGDAPVLLVNNKRMESFMSKERLDALLDEMKQVKR
jgi:NADH-quinone oxidoreductase subunit E